MSSQDSSSKSGGAYVVKEGSQWVVYVTVVYPDSVKEVRIGSYSTEAKAKTAAKYMGINVNRKIEGPRVKFKDEQGS